MSKKVFVKQVRSQVGRDPKVIKTLQAVGLGSIGKQKELTLNPSVQGMLDKVQHLVEITPVK